MLVLLSLAVVVLLTVTGRVAWRASDAAAPLPRRPEAVRRRDGAAADAGALLEGNGPAPARRLGGGRSLQQKSWVTGESVETSNGKVPEVTCPVGQYRIHSTSDLSRDSMGGQRIEGCKTCPRGTYGDSPGLTSARCSGWCPAGRYRDTEGARSVDDCLLCPEGKVGENEGLETAECDGSCPIGEYSDVKGISDYHECKDCPTGYRGWQCTHEIVPQSFDGTKAHAYLTDSAGAAASMQGHSPVTFAIMQAPLHNDQEPPVWGGDPE